MKYAEVARLRLEQLREQKAAKDRGEDPRAIIPTGLREFDKRAGTKRGIMTLIAGASGEGKDLWALHLMMSAAKHGYTVEVLSMEDPKERTVDRSFSTATGINNARMQSVDIDDKELTRIALAAAEVEEWGELIEFHDEPMSAREAMKLFEASEADLKICNYLQGFPDADGASTERMLAEFCWNFNANAKRTGSANVAFSQVNAVKVEERGLDRMNRSKWKDANAKPDVEGFRPFGVSDLSFCTSAGIRAKDFQCLFRPGRYLQRAGESVPDDRLEITRPKNNFGAEGRITVAIDLKTGRITDLLEKGKKNV